MHGSAGLWSPEAVGLLLRAPRDERPPSSPQQNKGRIAVGEGRVQCSYNRRERAAVPAPNGGLPFLAEGQNSPAVTLAPYPGERVYDNTAHTLC